MTGGRDVGVDVESRGRHVQAEKLIERFFASEEAAELGKLSYAEIRKRFFLTWTLKEAYIKALGRGFAQPLDSFSFRLTRERPHRIEFSAAPPQDPQKWRFAVVEPRPRFIAGRVRGGRWAGIDSPAVLPGAPGGRGRAAPLQDTRPVGRLGCVVRRIGA